MANKFNKRCIVLGAGFSKAIAGLPTTDEMFTKFKDVLKLQKELMNSIHVTRGGSIFSFLELLQNKYLADSRITSSNLLNNFEGICSYIDLNLSFDIEAVTKDDKGKIGDLTASLFEHNTAYLRGVRWDIGFYLYLTLINESGDGKLLEKFYNKFLCNTKSIISFNYDLVIEKYLFERKLWFPIDGYDVDFENKAVFNFPTSKIKIYKLHGSLNWSSDYKKLSLEWDIKSKNSFPIYPVDEENIYCSPGAWMLPSFVKQFSYPEFIKIWNSASQQIYESDEIYFIGYSLPSADSAVYSLLSTIDFSKKSVTVIDPNANDHKFMDRYSIALRKGKNDLNFLPYSLKDYLN